MAPTAV